MKRKMSGALFLALFSAAMLSACSGIQISDESREALSEAEDVLHQAVDTTVSEISETADLFKSGQENIDEIVEKYDKLSGGVNRDDSDGSILKDTGDIELANESGDGKNYTFFYAGDLFEAVYTSNNWKIIDSYKITNEEDIKIICEALSKEHQIKSKDGNSFRTAEDMAYEWVQHNIANELLPDDSQWKSKTKDVDLNPEDQGKTFEEFYEDRTGRELTIDEIMKILNM